MAPLGPRRRWCRSERSFSAPVASRKPSSLRHRARSRRAASSWPSRRQPVEEAGQRRAVAGVGAAGCPRSRPGSCRRGAGRRGRRRAAPGRLPRRSASKYQADDWPGSTSTVWPFSSRQRLRQVVGAAPAHLVAEPGRQLGGDLARVEEQPAVPSACRIAWPSGRGERITSPPRMLNSQAMEAGAVITAASRALAGEAVADPVALRGEVLAGVLPADAGTTGAAGCGGRASPQAGVERVERDAASAARRPCRGGLQAIQRVGAVQARVVADRLAGLGGALEIGRRRRPRPGRGSRRSP